jgi:hypothetical protein
MWFSYKKTIGAITIMAIACSMRADIFNDLIKKSQLFNNTIKKFPTTNNRIAAIAQGDRHLQAKIVQQAQDTYPLIHDDVRLLLNNFLEYKKEHGSEIEKKLYAAMDDSQLMMRLLEQRPLMFMTESDQYLLPGGITGHGGFEKIGTNNEQSPLILEDYISYDEMALASLIGMSVPTYFINNGARDNKGMKGMPESYEQEGIYVGLVGARFEKPGYMEWQHMIITQQQNTALNGYGLEACNKGLLALWSHLYKEKFPTFEQAQKDSSGRYVALKNGSYFDKTVYKKRIRFGIEPFLIDAHNRAAARNKKAYVHIVGLGLGVWQIDERQGQYMLEACAEILRNNNLSYISDIDFSWFPSTAQSLGGVKDGEQFKIANQHITIHFSKRNPADKLMGKNAGKLLVACYAWDGNSYPGNEYWAGMLTASGDPAAACCSTIAELQNPKINHYIRENSNKIMARSVTQAKVLSVKQSNSASGKDSLWQSVKASIQSWWKKIW